VACSTESESRASNCADFNCAAPHDTSDSIRRGSPTRAAWCRHPPRGSHPAAAPPRLRVRGAECSGLQTCKHWNLHLGVNTAPHARPYAGRLASALQPAGVARSNTLAAPPPPTHKTHTGTPPWLQKGSAGWQASAGTSSAAAGAAPPWLSLPPLVALLPSAAFVPSSAASARVPRSSGDIQCLRVSAWAADQVAEPPLSLAHTCTPRLRRTHPQLPRTCWRRSRHWPHACPSRPLLCR
jgi:hypothetical protein